MSERITYNPQQCGGKPCIRGMRIRVADILELDAAGLSSDQILADYPDLEAEDLEVALRYAAHSGEIDIIAMRRDIVVFVEVKARAHREAGLMAISQEKQRRFARAVHHWVGRNPWSMNRTLRCDAIIVLPMRLPYHLEDAFQLSMA